MERPNERVSNTLAADSGARVQRARELLNRATKHQRPAYMKRQELSTAANNKAVQQPAQRPAVRRGPSMGR